MAGSAAAAAAMAESGALEAPEEGRQDSQGGAAGAEEEIEREKGSHEASRLVLKPGIYALFRVDC